jgi:hypothetical protein
MTYPKAANAGTQAPEVPYHGSAVTEDIQMKKTIGLGALTLALAAAPLAAQISPRTGGSGRTGSTARDGVQSRQDVIDAARARIEAARTGTRVDSRADTRSTGNAHVPPGHLPPRGMCRVWVDGVPPGHQPPVTSCAQAESDRFRYSNARVIYGDRESFRGRGKGKFKNATDARSSQRQCSIWDGVVMNGRVENVCRDGSVYDGERRSGSILDRDRDGVDDRWDRDIRDDRLSQRDKSAKKAAKAVKKANKGKGKGSSRG